MAGCENPFTGLACWPARAIIEVMETLSEYVMRQLAKTTLSYQQTADGSGVSRRTVEKITRREIVDPGVSHMEKFERFFRELESQPGDGHQEQYEALLRARRAAEVGA